MRSQKQTCPAIAEEQLSTHDGRSAELVPLSNTDVNSVGSCRRAIGSFAQKMRWKLLPVRPLPVFDSQLADGNVADEDVGEASIEQAGQLQSAAEGERFQ